MKYDIVIVGGGLVGASLAAALSNIDFKIALIDAKLPKSDDPRLFALNISSCELLRNIGIWDDLSSVAEPIHSVHVSRQKKFGVLHMHAEDVKLSTLGHVIPAYIIEQSLNKKLESITNIDVYRPAVLKNLIQDENLATLTLAMNDHEQIMTASLVIAADGTESTVRNILNIPTQMIDYAQSALVTRTTLKRSHAQIAYERFVDGGAIAMLPLANNECATIWSGDHAVIQSLMMMSEDRFLDELQKQFGYRLGKLLAIKTRHIFPLRMIRAEKMAEGTVLLLGNALHTLHPIAAQGLNLALFEVAMLVDAIKNKYLQQQLLSSQDFVAICQDVKAQQQSSISVSHRLAEWFANDSQTLSIALQLGLLSIDMLPIMKKTFMKRMIGRSGRVPSLLLQSDKV